ncbi:MAG: NADH-quinone oxidoreductase subunit G [Robiginitomaculum sp.]|nr:MAG: NADH-quinone oxidoreductase subunit G [Robiginitomaculum sp.]
MTDLRKVNIDGAEIEVPGDYTLMQACEEAGAEIPRFCYHERLSVAGNCRMCLVEWVGAPKPQASCALQIKDLRPNRDGSPANILTSSPTVKKAREGVMEFLLINHPLDCPICDQGGECDLQDQAMGYGRVGSRFDMNKRAVDDKYMGPLVATVMTRCIQCTRCVRFITEVAGVSEIGLASRGEDAEITTYLEKSLTSEMSGNIIDLCPVGALTSKPYAFNARPWELEPTETIDVMDAVGSNIRVDSRGGRVLRIVPVINDDINEEWISDKTRFVWDGLGRQRLDQPFVRKNGQLMPASWDEALAVVAEKLGGDPQAIAAIAGDLACTESLKALMDLMDGLGVKSIDCRQDGAPIGSSTNGAPRQEYLMNTTIAGIEQADALLIVGSNVRHEAALVNARIRKSWIHGDLDIAVVGVPYDLTYDYAHLGETADALEALLKSTKGFARKLKLAKNPMILIGQGALARKDGAKIMRLCGKIAEKFGMVKDGLAKEKWNGWNVLHTAASRVAGLDMGFVPAKGGRDLTGILAGAKDGSVKTIYNLGADEISEELFGDAFVVYQGSHGDAGAHRADVILPGLAYTEKDALWVNTEGRVQMGFAAVPPKGDAKTDWKIIRALSELCDRTLPYDDLGALRAKLFADHPTFAGLNHAPGAEGAADFVPSKLGTAGKPLKAPLKSGIGDFYFTNSIARASQVMAQCSKECGGDAMISEGRK